MWRVVRPLLFSLPPEAAHRLALRMIQALGWSCTARSILRKIYRSQDKPVDLWGLRFPNRVGLAAGWDKDGLAIDGLSSLGFGHIEIGTVTPKPQGGRAKPRIFRLPEDESIINRMGFPSKGEDHLFERFLYLQRSDTIIGVNIGKNSDTPNERAHEDYCGLLALFARYADYVTINLSSPNTEGLRDLQSRNAMEHLLENIRGVRRDMPDPRQRKPVLVKISPDLTDTQLEESVGVALDKEIDGIIVTNTTTSRIGLTSTRRFEAGGASGKILTDVSREALRKVVHQVDGRIPVISSGGIMTPKEGKLRVDMGASLVQLYTGFVYHGPKLVKQINQAL